MRNVLIVSSSEKMNTYVKEFLNAEPTMNITSCKHGNKARRLTLEHAYDIIIINYPLLDEKDYELPLDLAAKSDASILIMVGNEVYETLYDKMESSGIFVFCKPINKTVLMQVLKFALITQNHLSRIRNKTVVLTVKLQEIKIIDRAKCLLIEKENISEQQAHRYLEKKAMDTQTSRLQIAKRLIEKYQ